MYRAFWANSRIFLGAKCESGFKTVPVHALHAKRDGLCLSPCRPYRHFYSRASYEARLLPIAIKRKGCRISTHAPLARRDFSMLRELFSYVYFYSHASCEARPREGVLYSKCLTFLLTRLLRGATKDLIDDYDLMAFLLTRLLRGTTFDFMQKLVSEKISTHAPHARRDMALGMSIETRLISTHAPLARRDMDAAAKTVQGGTFLLTHLLRGATDVAVEAANHLAISTHTPLARRDSMLVLPYCQLSAFLLTRLLRGATEISFNTSVVIFHFYSHASCEARRH